MEVTRKSSPSAGGKDGLATARLCLVVCAILFSLGGWFIKELTRLSVSAPGIVFYRSAFAALCLAPLVRGRALPRLADWAIAVVLFTALLGLFVAATQGTSAANAIFLQYTAPLYVVLLGPYLLREPRRRADLATLALAITGIAVLFFGSPGGPRWQRDALAMGAASGLFFGLYLMWLRRLRYADPVAVTALNNAGCALLILPLLLAIRPAEIGLLPRALGGDGLAMRGALLLVLMGGVQIALPYTLMSAGLRRIASAEASLLTLVEPLLNPVWVWLAIGERPAAATVMGGSLILLALALRYTLLGERTARE
ncbi:MAG: DMT family transporter [Armatimonadetes bacterium]|nr:DMT family transporter [Armatimonadota bacterium]